jgi:hypothetical protein
MTRIVNFIPSILILWMLSETSACSSPFAGIWQGQMNGLPGIELRIQDSAGRPTGEIVFYFQERKSDGPWTVKSDHAVPLLNVKTEGKSMTFEVTHHKSHGSPELGPNVKFRVQWISGQELRLFKVDSATEPGSGLKLTRKKMRP